MMTASTRTRNTSINNIDDTRSLPTTTSVSAAAALDRTSHTPPLVDSRQPSQQPSPLAPRPPSPPPISNDLDADIEEDEDSVFSTVQRPSFGNDTGIDMNYVAEYCSDEEDEKYSFMRREEQPQHDQLLEEEELLDIAVVAAIAPVHRLLNPRFEVAVEARKTNYYFMVVFLKWMTGWNSSIMSADIVAKIMASLMALYGDTFPKSQQACVKALGLQSQLELCIKVLCRNCFKVHDLDECYQRLPSGVAIAHICQDKVLRKVQDGKKKRSSTFRYEQCGTTLIDRTQDKSGVAIFRPSHPQTMIYLGMQNQIKRLLSRPAIRKTLWHFLKRKIPDGIFADIYDGNMFKRFQQTRMPSPKDSTNWFETENQYDLALLLNCDAFQPFKKTSYSVTCFWMAVANLPRSIRYLEENIILIAIFPGTHYFLMIFQLIKFI
jgi:hypothetical protein